MDKLKILDLTQTFNDIFNQTILLRSTDWLRKYKTVTIAQKENVGRYINKKKELSIS
jgi:hypothetical protein